MTDMSDNAWDDCYETAVKVAKEAGAVIKEAYHAEKKIETKSCFADLVTETDKKVEDMIIGTIKKIFPTHSFIGEESASEGIHQDLTDNPTWIIDPIDGTTNFVHRFPNSAVSIALVANKKAVVGVVYNPMRDEMFSARVGHGAFLNGQKLSVSDTSDLSKALVSSEFGSSRDPAMLESKLTSMKNVVSVAHGLRTLGSAALNMCNVAAGRVDAYWEFCIHAWDIAAADLIVREAGGVVFNTKGGPLDILDRRVLCAGTEKLALEISKLIIQIDGLERD